MKLSTTTTRITTATITAIAIAAAFTSNAIEVSTTAPTIPRRVCFPTTPPNLIRWRALFNPIWDSTLRIDGRSDGSGTDAHYSAQPSPAFIALGPHTAGRRACTDAVDILHGA